MSNRKPRFVPRIEALEGRDCPAATLNVFGSVMVITGDNAADAIAITDNGAGAVSVTGVGAAVNRTGIQAIIVNTRGGNDTLSYTLTAPLGQARALAFDPGAGDDTVTVNLSQGVTRGGVGLSLEGSDGNDNLSVTLGAVAAGTLSGIEVKGGKGNDTLGFAFTGALNGSLKAELDGQDGADTATATYNIAAGSTGRLDAKVDGGKGNDTLSLQVVGALRRLEATLDGGDGVDIWSDTANVRTKKVETRRA